MINRFKVLVLLSLYLVFFVVGFSFVWLSLPSQASFGLYDFGRVLGVWGLTCLSIQFVLSSRLKLLERGVGLDRIMRFHSFNAKFLFLAVLFHPLSFGVLGNFSVYSFFHWLGFGSFLFLALTLITSLFSRALKLNYEHWKIFHKTGYVILVLGFVHSFFMGSDIFTRGPVFYWWLSLLTLSLAGILARALRKTYEFEVVNVNKETHNIWTIKLRPLKGKVFDYNPGQFAFVRFFGGISSEEHHFTISSSFGDEFLSFSIKESGDFTSTISKLKKGDSAVLDGPYGVFSNIKDPGPFLFIAGGIGITPIVSMIRNMKRNKLKKDSVLLYVLKSKKDAAFYRELEEIAKEGWLKIIFRFTEDEGHVDRNLLRKIGKITSRKVFLVGPEPMMQAVKKLLFTLGVSSKKILMERFVLK